MTIVAVRLGLMKLAGANSCNLGAHVDSSKNLKKIPKNFVKQTFVLSSDFVLRRFHDSAKSQVIALNVNTLKQYSVTGLASQALLKFVAPSKVSEVIRGLSLQYPKLTAQDLLLLEKLVGEFVKAKILVKRNKA